MAVTQADVKKAAQALGIQPGDTVLIHSSFKSLGPVDGGAASVIGGFLDAVGPDGNLVFPTLCQQDFGHAYENWHLDAPSDVGYLTNYFRKLPGALRSDQATHSVAAMGKDAYYLTCTHGQTGQRYGVYGDTPFSADSPWEKMYKMGAKMVCLGVGLRKCTFRHYAEYCFVEKCLAKAAGSPDFDRLKAQLKYFGRTEPDGIWPHIENEYVQIFMEAAGQVQHAQCGDAELLLVNVSDFLDQAWELMDKLDPQVYRTKLDTPERAILWKWLETIKAL